MALPKLPSRLPHLVLVASSAALALAACGRGESDVTPATETATANAVVPADVAVGHSAELDAQAMHAGMSPEQRRAHDEMMARGGQGTAQGGQPAGGNNPSTHSAAMDAQAMHETMSADQRRMHDEMMELRQQAMAQGQPMPPGNAMPMQDDMDMPMNKGAMPGMTGTPQTPAAKGAQAPAPMPMKDHM